MIVGCVKEIKIAENRVGLLPAHAYEYIKHGHQVLIETTAGEGSGIVMMIIVLLVQKLYNTLKTYGYKVI